MKNLIIIDGEHLDYPSLGPVLYALSVAGIRLRPESKKIKYFSLMYVGYIAILVSVYIDLWNSLGDIKKISRNLSSTIVEMEIFFKFTITLYNIEQVKRIVRDISKFEVNLLNTEVIRVISLFNERKLALRKFIKIYYVYTWFSVNFLFTVVALRNAFTIYENHDDPLLVPAIATDYYIIDKTRLPTFYIGFILDVLLGNCNTLSLVAWNSFFFCILQFFSAHLDILKLKLECVFDVDDEDIIQEKLIECQKYYMFLYKNARELNHIFRKIMFVHFLLSSFCICFTLVELAVTSLIQIRISKSVFVTIILSELLMYYWASNEVFLKSQQLSQSLYKSEWYNKLTKKTRRTFLLMLTGLDQPILFYAGPIQPMMLDTFVQIIRTAYRFFTLTLQIL